MVASADEGCQAASPTDEADVLSVPMRYAFNSSRFGLRGWAGHGGVVYDDADSTLYEVSESAFHLLTLLKQGETTHTSGQLAHALMGEPPEDEDVALVETALGDLIKMGVVTCLSA